MLPRSFIPVVIVVIADPRLAPVKFQDNTSNSLASVLRHFLQTLHQLPFCLACHHRLHSSTKLHPQRCQTPPKLPRPAPPPSAAIRFPLQAHLRTLSTLARFKHPLPAAHQSCSPRLPLLLGDGRKQVLFRLQVK